MRRLAMAAVGISVAVMAGVWVFSGRPASHGVPVIEPDARPLRVKPDNPGGMQVAGADDAVLNGNGGQETDRLAPPPETPAPQDLTQGASPVVPVPAPAVAAPVPAGAGAGAPDVQPPPHAAALPPAPVAAPPQAAAPAAVAPAAVAKDGGTTVQLGSLPTEQAARAEWERLRRRAPDLFKDRTPGITRAVVNGTTYWRLRTGGFADIAAATAFCTAARQQGAACALARW
jgi:hypothetical protein